MNLTTSNLDLSERVWELTIMSYLFNCQVTANELLAMLDNIPPGKTWCGKKYKHEIEDNTKKDFVSFFKRVFSFPPGSIQIRDRRKS